MEFTHEEHPEMNQARAWHDGRKAEEQQGKSPPPEREAQGGTPGLFRQFAGTIEDKLGRLRGELQDAAMHMPSGST